MPTEYIVTVVARDRVGIVADVSRGLSGLRGNITDLSQTLLRGYFTLIISAEMPDSIAVDQVHEVVSKSGTPGEFGVEVRLYEPPAPTETLDTERFVLTTRGEDKPGIIARVTSYLQEGGINIEDFYAHVVAGDLLMILHVAVPSKLNTGQVQQEIEQVGKEFDLTVHLQHENIFRVTNEVRAVRSLKG